MRSSAPLALRLVHFAVFLGLGVTAIAASRGEWAHFVGALSGPLHSGEPPRPVPLLASVLASVGFGVLCVFLVRGRSAPLAASSFIVLGAALALFFPPAPDPTRSPESRNIALIRCGEEVRAQMVEQLQLTGDVPDQNAFKSVTRTTCPRLLRDRTFAEVPPDLTWLEVEAPPESARAGTLAVYRSADGARFAIHPLGWSGQGSAKSLTDPAGNALWLRATFNPQL